MLPFPLALVLSISAAQSAALPRPVPYLPQTEALCGGAAAAMVMRYWGSQSANPEDFAPLIDQRQGGITTTALLADLRQRGWQAFPLRGTGGDDVPLRRHLSRGRPIIALIEDRPSRYHYVVVTAVDAGVVSFHDPAVAPSQTMPRAEFDRRWHAANFWMLLLLPGTGTRTEPGEPTEPVEPMEPPLAAAVAGALRAGNTAAALEMARAATVRNPDDPVAWDALGTTLFVMDRDTAALQAWNRSGKPDVDTVQISGLSRTRFRAAASLINVESGDRLTPGRLGRARRRLALLPSSSASRVGYTPLADGRVEIDAAIVERSRIPGGVDLAMMAAKAPFSRDVELAFTNLVGAGERVSGFWRFREGFERIEAAVETPAPIGVGAVWKLSGIDARETHATGAGRTTTGWRRAAFQASDWRTAHLGWTAAAGVERWPQDREGAQDDKLYAAGRAMFAAGTAFDGHVTAEGWMRGAGATRLSGRGRLGLEALGGRLTLLAGAEGVHGRTPLFLLAGAGDGHLRKPLLRAHPLVDDGAITVAEGRLFGRRLLYGTAEWARPLARLGIVSLDAALFTDAARARQLLDGRYSDAQIDAGAGLRARLLGAGPSFRIDVARGLLDGRWAVTAGTVVGVEWWIF